MGFERDGDLQYLRRFGEMQKLAAYSAFQLSTIIFPLLNQEKI